MSTSKRKTGRPTIINSNTIAKLTEALRLDLTIEKACDYAGISKDTYYRHLKEKDFSDDMRRAQMHLEIESKKSLARGVKEDPNLALKVLERRDKELYSPRLEHSVDGQLTINQIITSHLQSGRHANWDEGGLNEVNQGVSKGEAQSWDVE
tara:strand:+ start:108 stop:560 length:453 start_codon:yes stop_codon:yes gene_type:complete